MYLIIFGKKKKPSSYVRKFITCDATGAQLLRRLQQIATFESPFLIDNHQAYTKKRYKQLQKDDNGGCKKIPHKRVTDQTEMSKKKKCASEVVTIT